MHVMLQSTFIIFIVLNLLLLPFCFIKLKKMKGYFHFNVWVLLVTIHISLLAITLSSIAVLISSFIESVTGESVFFLDYWGDMLGTFFNNFLTGTFITIYVERFLATCFYENYEKSSVCSVLLFCTLLDLAFGGTALYFWKNVGTYNENAVTYTYYSTYVLLVIIVFTVTRWNQSLQHLRSTTADIHLSARYQVFENIRIIRLLRPLTICNVCGVLGSGLLITLIRKSVIPVNVTFTQSNVYYYMLFTIYGTISIIILLREALIFRPLKRLRKIYWRAVAEKRVSPLLPTDSPKLRKNAIGKMVPLTTTKDEQNLYFAQFKQLW